MYYERVEKELTSKRRKEKAGYIMFRLTSILIGLTTLGVIALIVYALK